MQKQLLNNANHHATGTIREVIADSYFKGSGFSKLESKCGANHLANSGSSVTAKATGKMLMKAIEDGQTINKIVVGVNDQNTVILNLGNKVEVKP